MIEITEYKIAFDNLWSEHQQLQARVKELEAQRNEAQGMAVSLGLENRRLRELLETAHRYEIAHIYGSENAKDHRNGQKTGCVVCDMVSGRVPTALVAKDKGEL